MQKLYMAVTPDEYELPLFVTTNIKEMAKFSGKTENLICSDISKGRSGKNRGMKFIKIFVE